MNSPSSRSLIACLAASALAAGPAVSAATLFEEDFDGDTNATTSLNLQSRDNSGETTLTVAGDKLNILTTNSDYGSASTGVVIAGDFTVSADVSPNSINFTAGSIDIFAFANFAPTDDTGYAARLANDGFSGSQFNLDVVAFGTTIGSIALGDITAPDPGTFTLALDGQFQGNGDLLLTASFTPSATDNPSGLTTQSVSGTVAAIDVDTSSTLTGVRHGIFGGNDIDTDFDNFQVLTPDVVIPEPSSAALAGLGALCMLQRRRRQH